MLPRNVFETSNKLNKIWLKINLIKFG